jgi:hypothetical protein
MSNSATGYMDVLLPPAPSIAFTDTSIESDSGDAGREDAVEMTQPGLLDPVGLKTLEEGPGMLNPLRHLVDLANRVTGK